MEKISKSLQNLDSHLNFAVGSNLVWFFKLSWLALQSHVHATRDSRHMLATSLGSIMPLEKPFAYLIII